MQLRQLIREIIKEQQKKKIIRNGKVSYITKCDSDEKAKGDTCRPLTGKEKLEKKLSAQKAKQTRKMKIGSVKSVKSVKSVDA